MAALATMMQTPRPPCSAPHRPSRPGRRESLRPAELRGPVASRPPPLRPPPSRAAPSRAATSRAAPSRAATSRAAPSRTPLSRTAPSRAPPGWAVAGRVPAGCIRGGRVDGFTPGWAGRPRVCAPVPRSPVPRSPPRPAGDPGSRPSLRGSRGPRGSESRPPRPGSRPRGSDLRASRSPQPESREGVRGPAAGVRATPGGGQGSPRGLAPGLPPYGLLGRASRHSGLLICASDVSRCALVTEPRR